MLSVDPIDSIIARAASIKDGGDQVKPGQPVRFTEAAAPGDFIRQGDLYLEVIDAVPAGYSEAKRFSGQLVPGNTEGAKHCLASTQDVEVYLPGDFGPKYDGLQGPCFKVKREATVLHPTHGSVTIPAGFTILCTYQREWDAEQARERRNAD